MNIFFLHNEPATCAQMHCDKHVVKMILEYSQLLSTAHHVANHQASIKGLSISVPVDRLLKATHVNHPCAIWTRQTKANYLWLCRLLVALHKEYTLRYSKVHKLHDLSIILSNHIPILFRSNLDNVLTVPALAMPLPVQLIASRKFMTNEYDRNFIQDVLNNFNYVFSIYAYRLYYVTYKAHMLKYTNAAVPKFITNHPVTN